MAYYSDRQVNECNDDTKRNSDQSPKSNSDAVMNDLKEFSEKLKDEKFDLYNNKVDLLKKPHLKNNSRFKK